MLTQKLNITKQKIIDILLLTIYMVITAFFAFNHVSWRDEAQAWLIAKDLSPLEIIMQMRYEGHPFLWHFIIMIFAKSGLSYYIMPIISWFICSIAVCFLIKKSTLDTYLKTIIIFSPFFLMYAIVPRSYCLCALFTVLISVFYKERKEKPILYGILIALLANTHCIMLGLAGGVFMLEYVYEYFYRKYMLKGKNNKKIMIGGTIAFVGLIIPTIIAIISKFTNSVTKSTINFGELLFYLCAQSNILTICFVLTITIILVYYMFKKKNNIIFIVLCGMGWYIFINCFIYFSNNAIYTLLLTLLFAVCNSTEGRNLFKIVFSIFVIVSCINIIPTHSKYIYSNSKDVANFINYNISEDAEILCTCEAVCSSIIPYLNCDKYFWNIRGNRKFRFSIWDEKNEAEISFEEFKSRIYNIKNKNADSYLVHAILHCDEYVSKLVDEGCLKLIYSGRKECLTDEYYDIYVIY